MSISEGNSSARTDDASSIDSAEERSWLVNRGLIPEIGPKRTLAAATFVNQIGNGLFMIGAALFFTRAVGLSVAQVGIGMGVAAIVGLLSGIPIGHLADRRGPREIYLVTLSVQAVVMAALVFVREFWLFLVVLCLVQLASSASQAVRGPLIRSIGAPNPTKYRSYLRAINNLAGSCGGVAAAVAVQVDTRGAYLALVLGNALTFVACAAVISRLPSVPPVKAPVKSSRWMALKDRPYVTVTVLDGFMSMHYQVLVFALPLWIVGNTDAPRWAVGLTVVVNTMMVVLLQVRASRGISTNAAATRAMRRAGVAFLIGMGLIAATSELPGWLAVSLIVLGVVVHTIGELWHAAASFELSFGLAPAHAQGQYSGLYGLGKGITSATAPPVLGLLCITWGWPGWLVMGVVFILIGTVMTPVVRWAERTRPQTSEDVKDA